MISHDLTFFFYPFFEDLKFYRHFEFDRGIQIDDISQEGKNRPVDVGATNGDPMFCTLTWIMMDSFMMDDDSWSIQPGNLSIQYYTNGSMEKKRCIFNLEVFQYYTNGSLKKKTWKNGYIFSIFVAGWFSGLEDPPQHHTKDRWHRFIESFSNLIISYIYIYIQKQLEKL